MHGKAMGGALLLGLIAIIAAVGSTQGTTTSQGSPRAPIFTGPEPPVVDAHPRSTDRQTITITGSASTPLIEIAGHEGAFIEPVTAGRFTARVPLSRNRLNRLFFTGLQGSLRSPAVGSQVIHDTVAPTLHIDEPAEGAAVVTPFSPAAPRIDVAGRVADLLTGFEGLAVSINGQPAEVDIGIGTNGTFFLPNLEIARDGETTIVATARDALGNSVARQVTVRHSTIPGDAAQMARIGGDAQTATVFTELPEALAVRVFRWDPIAGQLERFENKIVRFRVVRSDGLLSESPGGPGARVVQVATNDQGDARVWWTLGGEAGCGNNRVVVESATVMGTTTFCASSLPAPASQINVGSGSDQIAEVGCLAPEPLRVRVSDGCNGVEGVPVTFTVIEGNGTLGGSTSVTVLTEATGHAETNLRVGVLPGTNRVRATYEGGDPASPAVLVVEGVVRGEPTTVFQGLVIDNSDLPIEGARVTLTIYGQIVAETTSLADGSWRLEGFNGAGYAILRVDGGVAHHVGGESAGIDVPPGSFPALPFEVVVVPNMVNELPGPTLLPPLNPANSRFYSTTQETVLTIEEMPGVSMVVSPGSMTIDGMPAPDGVVMSLNRVNHDDVPMPMPDGASPPFAWTLQPAGARFDVPVKIFYPNMSALPPGTIANFLSYEHDTERFEIVATGQVSDDGFEIVTDPGSGLTVAGWGCNCPPYFITEDCCFGGERTCISNGELSGGSVEFAPMSGPILGCEMRFTAMAVVDSGGGVRQMCPDGSGSTIVIPGVPESQLDFTWVVERDGVMVDQGTGREAVVLAEEVGHYTCSFTASAFRECPPDPMDLIPFEIDVEEADTVIRLNEAAEDLTLGEDAELTYSIENFDVPLDRVELRVENMSGQLVYVDPSVSFTVGTHIATWREGAWNQDPYPDAFANPAEGPYSIRVVGFIGDLECPSNEVELDTSLELLIQIADSIPVGAIQREPAGLATSLENLEIVLSLDGNETVFDDQDFELDGLTEFDKTVSLSDPSLNQLSSGSYEILLRHLMDEIGNFSDKDSDLTNGIQELSFDIELR